MATKEQMKEQIFAAADELAAAGQNPTLANVRKALGGGSFTTISEAMNEWRGRKTSSAVTIREPLPPAMSEKLTDLGVDLWATALEIANARLTSERESLETIRQETETARQEAAEVADQVTLELEQAKARIADYEAGKAILLRQAVELRVQLAAANERAAVAEVRVEELRAELDRAHLLAREEVGAMHGRLEALEAVMSKSKPGSPVTKRKKPETVSKESTT
jgi:chromosome segregation ATPase